ncbi:uncharacterized protein [Hetaerina americana]|uniref:uncharacterized protein n=1 Tax=Hetaerina americana TaxID=62018 RepID=UPI003A7F1FAF
MPQDTCDWHHQHGLDMAPYGTAPIRKWNVARRLREGRSTNDLIYGNAFNYGVTEPAQPEAAQHHHRGNRNPGQQEEEDEECHLGPPPPSFHPSHRPLSPSLPPLSPASSSMGDSDLGGGGAGDFGGGTSDPPSTPPSDQDDGGNIVAFGQHDHHHHLQHQTQSVAPHAANPFSRFASRNPSPSIQHQSSPSPMHQHHHHHHHPRHHHHHHPHGITAHHQGPYDPCPPADSAPLLPSNATLHSPDAIHGAKQHRQGGASPGHQQHYGARGAGGGPMGSPCGALPPAAQPLARNASAAPPTCSPPQGTPEDGARGGGGHAQPCVKQEGPSPRGGREWRGAKAEEDAGACAGCGRRILDRFYLMAVERRWHASCLQCSLCWRNLDGDVTCYSKDGRIYCKRDYYMLFGVKRCARCHDTITASELVMRARDLVFHLRCFTCFACGTALSKGDHFAMRHSSVFCRLHFASTAPHEHHHLLLHHAGANRRPPGGDGSPDDGGPAPSEGPPPPPPPPPPSSAPSILPPGGSSPTGGVAAAAAPAHHHHHHAAPHLHHHHPSPTPPESADFAAAGRPCPDGRLRFRGSTPPPPMVPAVIPPPGPPPPMHPHHHPGDSGVPPPPPTEVQLFNGGAVSRQKGRPRKRKPKTDLESMTANLDLNTDPYLDVGYVGRGPEALSPGPVMGQHVGGPQQQRTKRMRTSFKHHQLRTMKSYFAINHNPDAKDLKQLSQKTGLPKRVLQVWFQNARAKWRRMMLKQDASSKCSPHEASSDKGPSSAGLLLAPPSSMHPHPHSAPPSPPQFAQGGRPLQPPPSVSPPDPSALLAPGGPDLEEHQRQQRFLSTGDCP